MTTAVTVYESPDSVRKDMEALRSQVADVLPTRIDPDRFLRVVAKAVIENPKLMACTRVSLLASIHEAAQLGLEPTGLLGSAYLVPYRRSITETDEKGRQVKRSVMVAQLIPGYRGLIDLARRGEIDAIQADVVRRRDHFEYEPTRQPNPVVHRPFIPDPSDPPEDRDRGPIVAVYMVATLRGGFRQPELMTYDEVEAVRRRSRAADDGPWITDYSEMARKTVVRRGSKYLPLTTEFRRALELDEEAERAAEPVAPALDATSPRATRMLLQRAAARTTDVDAGEAVETEANPSDEEAVVSDRSTPVVDDPSVVETVEPPVHDPYGPVPVAPAGTIPTPPPAQRYCGKAHDEFGTCSRGPDHTGQHISEQGKWR